MTKRILILFMVVAIVLAFAACTEVNTTAKPKATTPATTKATTVATTTEATTKATTEDTTVPTTAPTTAPTTVTTVTTVPTTVTTVTTTPTTPTTPTTVTTVTTATSATTAATTTAATTTAATTTAATTTAATTTAATTTAATTTAATTTAATTTAATTTAATTTAATTTAATTTAATTTAATTTAATTTATTTASTAAITAGDVYVDLDFDNNAITDKKGNVTCTPVGAAAVKEVEVIHNGVTKTVDALVIKDTTEKSWAECTFVNLVDYAQLNKLVEEHKGWTVEAFYVNKAKTTSKNTVVGIVCVTEGNVAAYGKQGWGIAENNGYPYFLTGSNGYFSTGQSTDKANTTDLVHVVGVYDVEKQRNTVYINGVEVKYVAATAFSAAQAMGKDSTGEKVFNMGTGFFLGGDPTVQAVPSDFPATDLTIVDVKIYAGALSEAKVVAAYEAATAEFKKPVDDTTSTTATTTPVVVPEAYVDVDFGNDAITDKKGNASFQKVGTPIVTTKTVTHNGVSKEVSALSIASAGNFVVGTFDKLDTRDKMNAMLAQGFSIEVFYLDNSSVPSAVFCMTELSCGFGIAHQNNKYSTNNQPYFVTGSGSTYNSAYPSGVASNTDLVHIVGVYNPTTKTQSIYVNGVLSGTPKSGVTAVLATNTTSSVHTGETPMFNTFGLGGDLSPTATKDNKNYIGDFLADNMTIVDAKFYTCVLTAEQVAEAYKTATASFVAAE